MEKEIKFTQIAVVLIPQNPKYDHRIYALTTDGSLMFNDVLVDDDVLGDNWMEAFHPIETVNEI